MLTLVYVKFTTEHVHHINLLFLDIDFHQLNNTILNYLNLYGVWLMNNESFGEWAKTIKTLFQGYADLIHIATCKLYVVIWYNSWDALSSLVVKKFSVDLVVIEISSQSFKPINGKQQTKLNNTSFYAKNKISIKNKRFII